MEDLLGIVLSWVLGLGFAATMLLHFLYIGEARKEQDGDPNE